LRGACARPATTSFKDYLDWLERSGTTADEWQEFVNALTTNLTSFFRENHHFVELARIVRESPARDWKIWCSAASTGEEPYSIAITMADELGLTGRFQIWASDIDTKVLNTARAGSTSSTG
jgi:chemotaxis protein methyltransferase CheR